MYDWWFSRFYKLLTNEKVVFDQEETDRRDQRKRPTTIECDSVKVFAFEYLDDVKSVNIRVDHQEQVVVPHRHQGGHDPFLSLVRDFTN